MMEALRKEEEYYTYADYCTWNDDERWELIDGFAYAMSPAPAWSHQEVSGNLFLQIANFLKGKQCKVFAAPFDVRLNAESRDDTVLQPDIVVICDRSKLLGTGCIGAPDMVVEIISPGTARRDRSEKFMLYQRSGVREYWIVDSDTKTLQAHVLEKGRYFVTSYTEADNAPVHVLEGCTINLADVFDER